MKDIKVVTSYRTSESSNLLVYYGDKLIFESSVWDDDVPDIKAVLLALQAEILKDALKAAPVIINNFTALPVSNNAAVSPTPPV